MYCYDIPRPRKVTEAERLIKIKKLRLEGKRRINQIIRESYKK